jgi:hypothetical protein
MYGLTRGTATLLGVAASGLLIWLAADGFEEGGVFEADDTGRYWWVVGLLAAAGFVMALSQLLGGWTKWGWPRISGSVFLLGFLPALVVGGWVLLYLHPGGSWLAEHVRDWSDDLGIEGVVEDLSLLFPAVAFALGLVFGFTFDTSGPRVVTREEEEAERPMTQEERVVERRDDADEQETVVVRRDDDDETVVERPPRS